METRPSFRDPLESLGDDSLSGHRNTKYKVLKEGHKEESYGEIGR